jgi:hypothetical protein
METFRRTLGLFLAQDRRVHFMKSVTSKSRLVCGSEHFERGNGGTID